MGERYSGGSYPDDYGHEVAAKDPEYNSRVAEDRENYEDSELADEIISKVHERYPTLEMTNGIDVHGSFHELFQSTTFTFSPSDVEAAAAEQGVEADKVMEDIRDIVKQAVLGARAEKKKKDCR